MGLLTGKKGLILGVANEQSIAWAVAKRLHAEGAELAFTYRTRRPDSTCYLASDLGRDAIRVNTLSPGTLMTRAASGIGDFGTLVEYTAAYAPLRRNATMAEVADSALILVSPPARGSRARRFTWTAATTLSALTWRVQSRAKAPECGLMLAAGRRRVAAGGPKTLLLA